MPSTVQHSHDNEEMGDAHEQTVPVSGGPDLSDSDCESVSVSARRKSGRRRRKPDKYSPSKEASETQDFTEEESNDATFELQQRPTTSNSAADVTTATHDDVVLHSLRSHVRGFRSHLRLLSQSHVLTERCKALVSTMKWWQN